MPRKALSVFLAMLLLIMPVLASKVTAVETDDKINSNQIEAPVKDVPSDSAVEELSLTPSVEGTNDSPIEAEELQASDFECLEQNGGLYIIGCKSTEETIEIPQQIAGKAVVGFMSLGDCAATVKGVVIPDSVVLIGESAFIAQASALETISIGSGVRYLDSAMFEGCKNLVEITVSENNAEYSSVDGVVYSKSGDTLVVYPLGRGADYEAPASVKNLDLLTNVQYSFVNISMLQGSDSFVTVDGVVYSSDMKKVISCDTEKSGVYVMPSTVTEISENAFNGCGKLTDVEISGSVTEVVYCAFANCSSLASVKIPSSVKSIGEKAFLECSSLKTLTVPDSVTKIEIKAFMECTSLESAIIGNAVTEIGYNAFAYCSSLTSVTLGNSVADICGAFRSCTALKSIVLPESLIDLDSAFAYCSSLASIVIPGKVTNYYDAFSNCTSLASVRICSGVENICAWAFSGCTTLKSVLIPDSVTSIENGAFSQTSIESITIPNSVTDIASYAFGGCTSLKSMEIPSSVLYIDNASFIDCISLTAINVSGDNPKYKSIDGILFNKEESILYLYPNGKTQTSYVIPGGVTTIEELAFNKCKTLASITIPKSVTYIGGASFSYCTALESLSIPDSVMTIDESAFEGCTSLTSVSIPDGVKTIAGSIFNDCTALESVSIPDSVTYTGGCAFANCTSLSSVKLSRGVTSIVYSQFMNCTSLTTITIPDRVKTIEYEAFFNCKALSTINIPVSVTGIEFAAFYNCSELTTVYYSGTREQWDNIRIDEFNECLNEADIVCSLTPGCIHTFSEWTTITNPTCTEAGTERQTCTACGTQDTRATSALGHSLNIGTIVPATCDSAGYTRKQCTRCNTIIDITGAPPLGHEYSAEWTIDIPATATTEGSKSHHCIRCDATADVTVISKLPSFELGDITGDGRVNTLDLLKIKLHIVGKLTLTGNAKIAADFNCDDRINTLDLLKIKMKIVGKA